MITDCWKNKEHITWMMLVTVMVIFLLKICNIFVDVDKLTECIQSRNITIDRRCINSS